MKLSKLKLQNITPLEALLGSGALFLVVLTICAVTLLVIQITKPSNDYAGRTITVSATGDAYQTPDVAEFSYTIRKEGKNVSETQTAVTTQSNSVLESLKSIGVQPDDIQTQNISANPKYEWQTKYVPCSTGQYCPPDGKNVLVGYESSITTSIRVRDFTLAGKILSVLGEASVSDIQGPSFTTEDPDKAMSEARNEALARARTKAQDMAHAMGVKLGRVVSFNEDGAYPIAPMYSGKMEVMAVSDMATAVPIPTISNGQDKVNVTVNVIYRIK